MFPLKHFPRPRINRLFSCRRQGPPGRGRLAPTKGRRRPDVRRGGPHLFKQSGAIPMKRLFLALALSIIPAPLAYSFDTHPRWHLTPGLARNDLTIHQICTTKWGSDIRSVTARMKTDVAEAYHFNLNTCPHTIRKGKAMRRAEIDHLIPRSLGGADDVRNLWPQCYEPVRKVKSQQADGANKKDRLESYLHQVVCHPESEALLWQYQQQISHDWLALYHAIYGNK